MIDTPRDENNAFVLTDATDAPEPALTGPSLASGFGFHFAIDFLRDGRALSRAGWNGKGMFIYLVGPGNYPPATDIARAAFNGGLVPYRPYIAMKTVDDTVVPWVASQSDLLADDWELVDV